ncbi:trehalase family glycosidase [Lichenihabitans sp. Uapishka_5]|uniref:MGH1-like glycoside hydrolase domain-containing protein n=1 Tax=Lichenihabitans sp. Uapishka_5 TaxID=3037302 RepID=UPI0029E7CCD0|nr:trehalase family glycosidase [Lichenihabitans sp. Uapishka_5]MDX7951758.1 trehalase family glycosidase [Lichenihabitans sp. Uapishka_5]
MGRYPAVPLARAWNSWGSRPAESVFLPLGLRITPVFYSTKLKRTATILPREDAVRLGRHAIDGSVIELDVEHGGTRVAWAVRKDDPFVIRGRWQGHEAGEWGQRFWIALAVSCDGGETVAFDNGIATIQVGRRFIAVASGAAPLQVTGHADLAALRADFEAHGYFHTASRSTAAPTLALRFNLEITRGGTYAAAVADTAALAAERARAALATPEREPALPTHMGLAAGALDAVRDVLAWNTLWDADDGRPYTTMSRIWNLGDVAVWYNDQCYAALLGGLFDLELARENLAMAHAGATPEGNVAALVATPDAWVDRSQPPLGSFVTMLLYGRTGERSLLDTHYDTLARNNRWWRATRDPDGSGLVSPGTSAIGEALYAGTAFGARNETGMDNSATHDEAHYDPATRMLSTIDLGLNCVVCLDCEMLAAMAAALGRGQDAAEFAAAATRMRDAISARLWDEARGLFANRQRDGGFVRSLSPTSFYPLLCGAATPAQARRLLPHLADPATFGGPFGLPNATRDDPAFADNTYWRGRIWPNVNYLVWQGLRRAGFHLEAGSLAAMGQHLFMRSWRERRIAAENYNATTGEPLDSSDTDPFYTWAALLPAMAVGEIIDVDPWDGWSVANTGEAVRLGPVTSPAGMICVDVTDGVLTLERGGDQLLWTDVQGRFTHLRLEPALVAFRLAPGHTGGSLRLPGVAGSRVVALRIDGQHADWTERDGGVAIDLDRAGAAITVALHRAA